MDENIDRTEKLLAQDFIDRDVAMRQLLANQLEIMHALTMACYDDDDEWMDEMFSEN